MINNCLHAGAPEAGAEEKLPSVPGQGRYQVVLYEICSTGALGQICLYNQINSTKTKCNKVYEIVI